MVALAFTIGNILNMILLGLIFWKNFKKYFEMSSVRKLMITTRDAIISAIVMGVVGYWILQILANIITQDRLWGVLLQGLIAGILGVVTGGCVLKLLKNPDIDDFLGTITKRFWKVKVVQDTVGTGVDI
jgi:peptidoglycan biosynthesis protein MviN/MurJ (putative lipid II flippase)